MAAVQLDLAVCSGLHLESTYTWRLFGKFTCSALGLHLECTWTSLGTTLKAFKSLRRPPKFSKFAKASLRRPSKAWKGLRRPPKAFEGSRMHLQSSRRVPRASRRPKARFSRVQKVQIEPERENEHSIFPSSALVSTGKSVRTHCIEHCFCYHG